MSRVATEIQGEVGVPGAGREREIVSGRSAPLAVAINDTDLSQEGLAVLVSYRSRMEGECGKIKRQLL